MGLGKSITKARTLGEIGSILYVTSLIIPNAILLIGGVVLLLLSVLDIVRDTEYKGSGNSFIIAMILDIVWLYVAAFAVALTLGAYKAYVERPGADCMGPMCDRLFPNPFGPGGAGRTVVMAALGAAIIAYVINIITGILYRNIYKNVGKITGVSYFERSANWIFWGRILSIVLVGLVVDLVGRVMLAISFFHLPDFLPSNEEEAQPIQEEDSGPE